MSRTHTGRRKTSIVLLAAVSAGAIAVAGVVAVNAAGNGRGNPFKNTAASRAVAGSSTSTPASSATTVAPGSPTWSLVRLPGGGLSVVRGAAAAGLRPNAVVKSGGTVLSVEPDVPVRSLGVPENDPMRPQQWALNSTSFEKAWSVARGTGVTVAVIDTGVDAAHEDLGSVVLPGIDYVDPSRDGRYDPDGHGTHVAGVIAARVNNGRGIVGAAPDVRILPVRVLDASGSGVSSNVAAGIIWAADHGARVINMSLGGGPSPGTEIAIQYAQKKGAVVLAAAGNNGATGNAAV